MQSVKELHCREHLIGVSAYALWWHRHSTHVCCSYKYMGLLCILKEAIISSPILL